MRDTAFIHKHGHGRAPVRAAGRAGASLALNELGAYCNAVIALLYFYTPIGDLKGQLIL